MAITNINEVERYLRTSFTADTVPTATQVGTIITSVEDQVEDMLGTKFAETEDTKIFDLEVATNELFIDKLPLVSVDSIYLNTGTIATPIWEDEITNYFLDGNMIIFPDKSYEGYRKIKVSFTYGFETVPADVKELGTLLVVKNIQKSEDISNNKFSKTKIGPIDTTRAIGANRFINIESDIKELKRRIGSYKKILR